MIAQLLLFAVSLYEIIMIIRIVSSWVQASPHGPFMQWIYRLTEPVLEPVRRLLPPNRMGIDFSPVIIFLLIEFVIRRLIYALFRPYPF